MTMQKGFSKRDFSFGQYDREYQASQGSIIQRGMMYCRNLLSSIMGEARTRPGTKFLRKQDSNTFIIPMRIVNDDILLCVADGVAKGYSLNENFDMVPFLIYDGADITLPTGWTSNTNGPWSVQSWGTSNAYLALGAGVVIGQAAFWDANQFAYYNISNATTPQLIKTLKVSFTASGRENSIVNHARYADRPTLQYSDDGDNWFAIPTKTANRVQTVSTSNHHLLSEDFKSNYSIEILNDGYSTPHKYWRVRFADKVFPSIAGPTYVGARMKVQNVVFFNTSTSELIIENLPFTLEDFPYIKYSQDNNTLVIVAKDKIPFQLIYNSGNITSGPFTPSATLNLWELYGYPSCVAFFQNRLWFAGFKDFPNRAASSTFGDYNDWTPDVGNAINASSPIITNCNQMRSRITDLFAGWDVLYAQCDEGIATIDSGNAAIAANNVSFLLKVRKRSSGITPAVKENMMLWVSRDRKSIYAIQFDSLAEKFNISDLTKFNHSFLSSGIEEVHYCDNVSNLVYGSLRNGKMFAILYDTEAQIIGLFPIETDGLINDITIIQSQGEVRVVAVIKRDGQFMIELFNPVIDLADTDAFGETRAEANIATKLNLIAQPFIDSATKLKDERQETWSFDFTTKILSAIDDGSTHTDFEIHAQNTIRFFTDDSRIYDLKIVGSTGLFQYNVEVSQGDDTVNAHFIRFQLPLTSADNQTSFVPNKLYQYFDSGRYMGDIKANDGGGIVFETPVYDCVYGLPYRKIGIIQDNASYLRDKKWGAIALNVMDTLSLKIGAKIDKLQNVMKWKGTDFYDSSPIMRNGILRDNISDQPEKDKQLIFMTDEGLPFCIRAIEASGEITDRNAN